MVYLILVDLGYLDSCIVIAPHNVKFDTTALCNYDTRYYLSIFSSVVEAVLKFSPITRAGL